MVAARAKVDLDSGAFERMTAPVLTTMDDLLRAQGNGGDGLCPYALAT